MMRESSSGKPYRYPMPEFMILPKCAAISLKWNHGMPAAREASTLGEQGAGDASSIVYAPISRAKPRREVVASRYHGSIAIFGDSASALVLEHRNLVTPNVRVPNESECLRVLDHVSHQVRSVNETVRAIRGFLSLRRSRRNRIQ